jgi:hypothetical protein
MAVGSLRGQRGTLRRVERGNSHAQAINTQQCNRCFSRSDTAGRSSMDAGTDNRRITWRSRWKRWQSGLLSSHAWCLHLHSSHWRAVRNISRTGANEMYPREVYRTSDVFNEADHDGQVPIPRILFESRLTGCPSPQLPIARIVDAW